MTTQEPFPPSTTPSSHDVLAPDLSAPDLSATAPGDAGSPDQGADASAEPAPATSGTAGPADTAGTQSGQGLRDLLARVASGDLDPAEAARLLDEEPSSPVLDTAPVPVDGPVSSLTIHAAGVKLTVVADPSVDTVVVDGQHSLRREGTTLVLDAPGHDGWNTSPPPRFLGWVPSVWSGGRGQPVRVRVNPGTTLTVEATACSVEVTGLRAALTLGGSASSVKVRDHDGALHGSMAMGSVAVVGTVAAPSDLTCELGSLDVRLTGRSDVTVTATSELGEVKVAGPGTVSKETSSSRQTLVVGTGAHPFTLAVRLGSATVAMAS